jgi:hypothetical protein
MWSLYTVWLVKQGAYLSELLCYEKMRESLLCTREMPTLHTSLSEIKSIKWMVFKVHLHWRHRRFVIHETSNTLKIWRSLLENGANRMNDHNLYVEFFNKYRYS